MKPNIHCYNSRLVGLVNENKFEEAVEFLSEMEKSGMEPDSSSYGGYGAMVRGYCGDGNLLR